MPPRPVSICLTLLIAPSSLGEATPASIRPSHPTCEYLTNPLGLDTPAPRLSWKLDPIKPEARARAQSAYQVLVASHPDKLTPGTADLWDSGWVESSDSQLIPYSGKALHPGMSCHWKLRVRDQAGTESPWSPDARWTMGPMSADDWTARWIGSNEEFEMKEGRPPADNTMPDPMLRKRISLSAKPARAIIHVASVGYHELHVNGEKVGDAVLSPRVVRPLPPRPLRAPTTSPTCSAPATT